MFPLILCYLLGGLLTHAGESGSIELPKKENFHLYLLVGQSNMAGRGVVEAQDREAHPRVLTLTKEQEWVPAVDPIHFDKSVAGVCLGRTFGIRMAERDPEGTIGLIPAACGGSSIFAWEPGAFHDQTQSHPYDDAIARARRAMEDGVLKGILWHQGESDCSPEKAPEYALRLTKLIERFRRELGAPEVPFIIGQLGQFPAKPLNEWRVMVDKAQQTAAKNIPFVGFVSSDDLSANDDNVHFNAASLREFGRRYVEVYFEVAN